MSVQEIIQKVMSTPVPEVKPTEKPPAPEAKPAEPKVEAKPAEKKKGDELDDLLNKLESDLKS